MHEYSLNIQKRTCRVERLAWFFSHSSPCSSFVSAVASSFAVQKCFFLEISQQPPLPSPPSAKNANLSLNRRVLWCDRENGPIKTAEISVMSRAHCFECSPHVLNCAFVLGESNWILHSASSMERYRLYYAPLLLIIELVCFKLN